ncbi:MAG TPA: SBBP repeat-containing protein [Candidatus Binatia bacterium]
MKILHKLLLKTAWLWSAGCVVCLLLIDPPALFAGAASEMPLASTVPTAGQRRAAAVRVAKARLPVYFIENRGQVDARVAYYVHGANKIFYFGSEGVTMALSRALPKQSPQPALARVNASGDALGESSVSRVIIKLDFVGANPAVKPVGEELSTARFSYFKGRREDWATGLKTYNRLAYRDLWPGIDLVYSGSVDRLKYLFVVKPGADPTQIRLRYRGAESVSVDLEGRLLVQTALEDFHDDKPIAYQELNGRAVDVATNYTLSSQANAGYLFGFNVGTYDPSKALVIDPVILVYSGFLGGSGDDRGNAIAVDSDGSAYITGETNSTQVNFPTTVGPDVSQNGGLDAFVAKVDPTGNHLLYAGFIGGSGDDRGNAIAVDSLGNAYITGETNSTQTTFPVTAGPDLTHNGLSDAFVAKVNASGTSLVYAGYIGGFGNDRGTGIAVDGSNRAYVTGETDSIGASFPDGNGFGALGGLATFDNTQNGGLDAFVARVAADGASLEYAGFIGGLGTDRGTGIAVDGSNRAYVTGETDSTDASFPNGNGFGGLGGLATFDNTQNGGLDAFVARVAANGQALEYAGYLGGVGDDRGNGIAVDGANNAYVTGETNSSEASFPDGNGLDGLPGPAQIQRGGVDAFVAKINSAGSALIYAGFIGGSSDDRGNAIALTPGCAVNCEAFIAGETSSTQASFPVSVGPDLSQNGGVDAFVAKVNGDGSLGFAGYVGGSGDDRGKGIALDGIGAVYLTGETNSNQGNFPIKGELDRIQNLGFDVFVAKFCVTTCADVSVTKSDTPDPVTVGTNVTYTMTITNNGPDIATDVELTDTLPGAVTLVSATPSAGTCTGTSIIVCDLGSLANGASATVIIVVRTTAIGTLTNTASVTLAETDTDPSNNVEQERTSVTLPDLVVKAISAVAAAIPGSAIVVNDTTANNGKVAAGPSTTSFFLSTDSKFDAGDLPPLGSRGIPALSPKQSSVGSTTLTIPLATAPGRYFIIGVADTDSSVSEIKEKNAKARALNVTLPDLTVQSLSAPSSAAAGANITVNETTSNKAPVPAGGSTTGYYLSVDAIFDGADVLLGSRSVGALAAKGKSAGSTTVTIPLGTTPGKYFLLAVSDAAGAVAEVVESNNVRSRSITITQ